jgi:hypothetical protein
LYHSVSKTDRLFRKLDNIQELVSRRFENIQDLISHRFETLFTFLDARSSDPTHPIKRDLRTILESSLRHDTIDFIPTDPSCAPDVQRIQDPWSWAMEVLSEKEREEFKGMFSAKESGGTMEGGSSTYSIEMVQQVIEESARKYALRFKTSVPFVPSWVADITAWMTEKMRIAPEVKRYWRIVPRRTLAT